MTDDDYDPLEDPTMFRAPKFMYDTASDVMNALLRDYLIDEFRVIRPKIKKYEFGLKDLTAATGVRFGEPNRAGRAKPWFTVHVESVPAHAFEGMMEGNPYGALLVRVLEKMSDPNTISIVGDGRHWVMWLERDGGSELNDNLSLGPNILAMTLLMGLNEGEVIWTREPRFADVEELVSSLARVPGIQLDLKPEALSYPYQTNFTASLLFAEELGWAIQNSVVGRKGVDFEVEILIESSYKNDIALRMEARKPTVQPAAYVSGDGWAIRVTTPSSDTWGRVNEPAIVAALISHKLGGAVTVSD